LGRNKDIRKRIAGYYEAIAAHEAKIKSELAKDEPNEGRIAYWQREVAGLNATVARLKRRLKRDW